MKRTLSLGLTVAIAVAMIATIAPSATARPSGPAPRRALACSVNALGPRVIFGPKRIQARADVRCTNGGKRISRIVVLTSVQWFCCTETQIQTIALNKRRFDDVASGTALRTSAMRRCTNEVGFNYAFRSKVVVWVYNTSGELLLRKRDFTPGGGLFNQLPCGDEDGF